MGRWPAIWLRDNCPCPHCRVPGSGQKLFQITELPDELAVTAVEEDADSVTVTFGPDGHRSRFDRSWLAERAGPARAGTSVPRMASACGPVPARRSPPGTGSTTGRTRWFGAGFWTPC